MHDILQSMVVFFITWLFVLFTIRGDINDLIRQKKNRNLSKTNRFRNALQKILYTNIKQYIPKSYYTVNYIYVSFAIVFLLISFTALLIKGIRPFLIYIALGKLPLDAIILIFDTVKTKYGHSKFK